MLICRDIKLTTQKKSSFLENAKCMRCIRKLATVHNPQGSTPGGAMLAILVLRLGQRVSKMTGCKETDLQIFITSPASNEKEMEYEIMIIKQKIDVLCSGNCK